LLRALDSGKEKAEMQPIRKTLIMGAGAMGAMYAAKLYQADPTCVYLLAGGERYERLHSKGLRVNGRHFHCPVLRPDDEPQPFDLILVALKHHHLAEGVHQLRRLVGGQTVILSVMNGIDSEETIAAVYGTEKVLYSVAVGMDPLVENGEVKFSQEGKLLFGEADNTVFSDKVKRVGDFFQRVGIAYEVPRDMTRTLWWKLMINTGINQASAVLRAPFGTFQTSTEARRLMESIMREVMAVARAMDINLAEQDLQNWYRVLDRLAPGGKTSMLQDIEAGRKTEVEMFAGKITELGARHGIPTPVNQTLLRIIRVLEEKSRG
jgi:2-dehydropantoate 2-reductase